jgi:hypothetical protein
MSTPPPVHGHTVRAFRKLAREAVIFMLLGPVVFALVVFLLRESHGSADAKVDAARAVYAQEGPPPPSGYKVENAVAVPLTDGRFLYVTDCAQAHPTGDRAVIEFGKMTYDDVFGVHHWVNFCNVFPVPLRPEAPKAMQKCVDYNQMDDNK